MRTAIPLIFGAMLSSSPMLVAGDAPPASQPAPTLEQAREAQRIALADYDAKMKAESRLAEVRRTRSMVDKEQAHVDAAREAEEHLRRVIQVQSGVPDSTGIPQIMRDLQSQRETLEQEEAAAKGRRAGLESAIEELSKRAKFLAVDDSLMKELTAVVDARQQKVDRLKAGQKAGIVAVGEMDDAVAELALARANSASAQQRLTSGANDAIDGWNRELMNLNIAAVERQERLRYINSRLVKLEPIMGDVDRLAGVEKALRQAEDLYRVTARLLFDAEAELNSTSRQ